MALAKGWHGSKAGVLGHILGGWPSNWNDGSISLRKADQKEFKAISEDMLCH